MTSPRSVQSHGGLTGIARQVTAASFLAGMLVVGSHPASAQVHNISGTWTLVGYKSTGLPASERIPKTIEGTPPPMNAAAAALYRKRMADSDRGEPMAPTSASCLPLGVPLMMMAANMPIQIIDTPTQVTMLFEEQHTFRAVRMNVPHPPEVDPGWFGDSVGHWEGDTLLIDTVGINDRTTLDLTGLPHSDAMHVVEHVRRVDDATLEDLITIDDPKTFTKPWTTRMRYQAYKGPLMEYVCDNNRNTPTNDNHASFQAKH